jgi:hypothetical protein
MRLTQDHVLGDARLRDLKPSVDAWRTPKRILHADFPYRHAQLCLNLRAPSPPSTRFPTPIAPKADPMPTHERLRPYDRENLQD